MTAYSPGPDQKGPQDDNAPKQIEKGLEHASGTIFHKCAMNDTRQTSGLKNEQHTAAQAQSHGKQDPGAGCAAPFKQPSQGSFVR